MFSFAVLLVASCVGAAWGAGPPRLNVGDEMVVRTDTPNDFQLRCEGSERVDWKWSTELPPDAAVIETREQDNAEYPFVSTLTVPEPYPEDTGFYRCHYKSAKNLETDKNNVASTYVYVNDGESIFVSTHHTSKVVKTKQKLVLECRTTLPNATLTLTKDGVEVTSHVLWDPKIGFVRLSVTVQDSGLYQCVYPPTSEIQQIYVVVQSASMTLQPPSIHPGDNALFVVGHPFTLNCSLVKEDVDAVLHWSYPNYAAKYETVTSRNGEGDNISIVSILHVPNASKNDSGKYTCTATAQQHEPSSASFDIEVAEKLQPYVNIKSPESFTVNLNENLKWKAEVFSFPAEVNTVYTNWKGDLLSYNERITATFNPATASAWLTIYNITSSDFGQYTLTATTKDSAATNNFTVSVAVKSAPSVDVMGVPPYLPSGRTLSVTCLAEGFPVPSILWEFQSCATGPSTCSPFKDIEDTPAGEASLTYPPPGNLVMRNTTFTLNSLGFLRCSANNSLGTANNTVPVAISDIGGLHVLRHTGLNTTTEITASSVLNVITNDDFLLLCGANKLYYKAVMLHTPPRYEGKVHGSEAKYSMLREVAVSKVTKDMHGKYSCVADRHDNTTVIKNVTINVMEETMVKFLNNSNMVKNRTVTVKENAPYFLNCTVAGTPTPNVTWKKDDKPLTPDSEFFDNKTALLSADMQRIHLIYVFKEKHVGVYTCTAENRLNRVTGRLVLGVPAGLSTTVKVTLAVSLVGIVILIATVVILSRCVKTERKFRNSFKKNELYLFEQGDVGQLNTDCCAEEQAALLPYDKNWEVPRDRIKLGKQLGSGAFGRVVQATVTGLEGPAATTVAIKMCKSQADQSHVRALTLELKIMNHLGKHLNIVNLMGANTTHIGRGELWILVEYCRFGNLLVFMHRHRRKFVNQIDPTTGRIDLNKLLPDNAAGSLLSPLSPGGSSWQYTNSRDSQERFSATPHTPITLSAPPPGHREASPQPQTSGTPQVHNPMYNPAALSPAGGGAFFGPYSRTEQAKSDAAESCGSDRRTLETTTSTGSDGRVQNTYLSSTLGSEVSQAPLSPTEPVILDSHGRPSTHEVGSVPGVNAPFTTSDLVCWAWQVAHGMDYLSSRKVLHGDLAARNLLLADDNVVKIGDFGLSREMYKTDVYMKKSDDLMPIKWISVEAIREKIFSVQSDVWAFGVTLWELFTLGSTPYPGIEVNKDFLRLLEDGYRMPCPKYANEEIYQLLLECWEAEPGDRPSFRQALHRLDAMLEPDIKGEYLNMNDQYMRMNEVRFKNQPDYLNMMPAPDYENMAKDTTDNDPKPHYLNMEVAGSSRRGTVGQVSIQSPEMVSYINTRVSASPGPTPATSDYLPMNCKRDSPSPENDVFSPRPAETSWFTFPHNERNTSTTEVPSTEDKPFLEGRDELSAKEHSTLITNGRGNT